MAFSEFFLTNAALSDILTASIDLDTDTFYAKLFAGAQTPAAADATLADWSANECTSTDYPGAVNLATPSIVATGKERGWHFGNANFGASVTISAKYLGVFKGSSASPVSTDRLMGWSDLSVAQTAITAITQANPGQTTAAGHGLSTGANVAILGSDMPEANRVITTATVIDVNTLTLDSTDLSAADLPGRTGYLINLDNTSEAASTSGSYNIAVQARGIMVWG